MFSTAQPLSSKVEVETTQMSVNRHMDKQMWYQYNKRIPFFFFFAVLGFELRAVHLLGRPSTS
jgi:hypothetical protein